MASPASAFQLRKVALSVYLPTFLFTAGESAMIPVVPAIAKNIGADLPMAGLVASMFTIGILVGDLPSGWFVAKVGERVAMIWSSALALAGILLSVTAFSVWQLALGMGFIGLATTVFALARHAFLTTFVPLAYRARALSLLGGMFRAGAVIGPLLTGALLIWVADPRWAYGLTFIFTLATVGVLIFMQDPETAFGASSRVREPNGRARTTGEDELARETHNLFRSVWENRSVLLRLGSGAACVGAVRTVRNVIFPLWAVSIGLHESSTGLILGIAMAVDFALFYTSGQVMDRWGRLASVLPSMALISIAPIVLAFTHNLSNNVAWFIACTIIFAVGNGLGSGIILTIGSDLAPKNNPAPFLGAWRFTVDAGSGIGPLFVAGMTALVSLSVATGLIGLVGIGGALIMLRYIPRYIPRIRKGQIADERLP